MNLTMEQFLELEFNQVSFLAEMLYEKKRDNDKLIMRAAAFNAYLMGAAPNNNFNDFMSSLGLSEMKTFTFDDKKTAIEKSERILEKLKKMGKI